MNRKLRIGIYFFGFAFLGLASFWTVTAILSPAKIVSAPIPTSTPAKKAWLFFAIKDDTSPKYTATLTFHRPILNLEGDRVEFISFPGGEVEFWYLNKLIVSGERLVDPRKRRSYQCFEIEFRQPYTPNFIKQVELIFETAEIKICKEWPGYLDPVEALMQWTEYARQFTDPNSDPNDPNGLSTNAVRKHFGYPELR